MLRSAFAVLLGFTFAADCCATPPHRPLRREVFSSNRKFIVKVQPDTKSLIVEDFFGPPDRNWPISHDVRFDQCLVTNDGERVVTLLVTSRLAPENPCLRFWTRDGELKAFRADELLKNPASYSKVRSSGTLGFNWFVNWFDDAQIEGDELRVLSIEGTHLVFSLRTGDLVRTELPLLAGWTFFQKLSLGIAGLAGLWIAGVLTAIVMTARRRKGKQSPIRNGS